MAPDAASSSKTIRPKISLFPGLAELDAQKSALKKSETRVRTRDGTIYVEKNAGRGGAEREPIAWAKRPQYALDQEEGRSRLVPKIFDETLRRGRGGWRALERNDVFACSESRSACDAHGIKIGAPITDARLSVVSYNVWFEKRNQEARAQAMFKILEESNAGIIALQEVTPDFLMWLRDERWVQENYVLSDSVGTTLRGSELTYGVITLVQKQVLVTSESGEGGVGFILHTLPTKMNRSVLVTEFSTGDVTWRVANTHLESLDNSPTREKQLKIIFEILSGRNKGDARWEVNGKGDTNKCASLLLGDLNFDANNLDMFPHEQAAIPVDYRDCWIEIHGVTSGGSSNDGITVPVCDMSGGPVRIDQALLSSKVVRPILIARLGMESFKSMGKAGSINSDVLSRNKNRQDPWIPSKPCFEKTKELKDIERMRACSATLEKLYDELPSDHYGLMVVISSVEVE